MQIPSSYPIKEAVNVLRSTALFSGVDEAMLSSAMERGAILVACYGAGETISSPSDERRRMIVLLDGEAEVYSADEHRAMLLRTLRRGGVVGVASLFSKEEHLSRVIAAKKCAVLEISAENYGSIIEKDSRAMYNYVAFLNDRIRYLNRKIVVLTAGSAERRLAYFLDSALPEGAPDGEIKVQMNSLCEMLNLGRASLYRAADKLSEEGFILRDGKLLRVLNRSAMMEKYR